MAQDCSRNNLAETYDLVVNEIVVWRLIMRKEIIDIAEQFIDIVKNSMFFIVEQVEQNLVVVFFDFLDRRLQGSRFIEVIVDYGLERIGRFSHRRNNEQNVVVTRDLQYFVNIADSCGIFYRCAAKFEYSHDFKDKKKKDRYAERTKTVWSFFFTLSS
jgi:hypothetical protein